MPWVDYTEQLLYEQHHEKIFTWIIFNVKISQSMLRVCSAFTYIINLWVKES